MDMNSHLLNRRLRDDDPTCPVENHGGPTIVPFVSGHTFHSFATILSGACGLLSVLIVLIAIFRHARHYSSPIQQRLIIRILFLVPWMCFFCFLIVWQVDSGAYLVLALDVGCSFALASFLLLMCDYVLSNQDGFNELFGPGASKNDLHAPNSPKWLKRVWYAVLQFIPSSIILWIVTAVTMAGGVYCEGSNSIHYAHIWVIVLKVFVTSIAIVSVLKFYKNMKRHLAPHTVLMKLISFKGVIGINVLQTFIINILVTKDVVEPNKYMTFEDIQIGLPSLLLACEMPIFAVLLFISFPTSPYESEKPQHGVFTAIFQAINLRDLLSAFVRGPMRMVREQQIGLMRQGSFALTAAPDTLEERTGYDFSRGRGSHV